MSEQSSKRAAKRVDESKFIVRAARSISVCPVQIAIGSLLNTRVWTHRLQGDSKSEFVFDADVLRLARGMFPSGKTYRFDMFATSSLGSTAAGALLNTIPISPAVVSYQEWPALSALFEEVVLVRSICGFQPQIGADGQYLLSATATKALVTGAIVGANPNNISSVPASYVAVGRLAHATPLARTITDTSGVYDLTFMPPSDRPYARTATPAVQDPPAGCLGSFDVAFSGTVSISLIYYNVNLWTTVKLRNRS
jgi:hypothetical protein